MGMKQSFNIEELSDFIFSLKNYQQLASHLPQIDPVQKESLDSIWKQNGSYEGQYYNSPVVQQWNQIDIYITSQMWGSTSCRWGGMGGAAMTTKYNYIIHQLFTDLYYVYWDGKLAFIIKASEIKNLSRMPSLGNNREKINFIYRKQ